MRRITNYVNKLMVFAVSFLMLSFCAVNSTAASNSKGDVFTNGKDYTAILYDSLNGLPTSESNAIVQSPDGFIWLGGYSGFIRYDGTEFYRFDSSTGVAGVFSLIADDKNRVWIGTNENGIAYYEGGLIFSYGRSDELNSASVRSLAIDDAGNVIVGTAKGMGYVDSESLELHGLKDTHINTEYIVDLCSNGSDTIYGLTLNGDIFSMKDLTISEYHNAADFGDLLINTIATDPENPDVLYMGSQGSEIYLADTSKGLDVTKKLSADPLGNINAIKKIGDNLWVASTNGIGYFDKNNRFHEMNDLPMHNAVGNIMTDLEGNIWFTSTRQGVMKIVPDRFTDISRIAGLESMVVNTTCISDGLLYVGADNGLVILDDKRYTPVQNELTDMLQDVRIRCIIRDEEGNVWICTHGDFGLVRYGRGGEITCFNSETGLDASRVRAATVLDDGSIAAATGNGLYIIKDGEISAHFGQDEGVSTTEILSVSQGDDGKIYLGSDGDGIYVIEGTKVTHLGYDDGLTSEVVMRIKCDSRRELFWLITSNSIEYMKDGVITAITNFPYSNNYDIIFDNNDNAWVLSSSGIYITKVSGLLADENIEYSFFNIKSGLPYIPTGNARNYLSDDGILYFAGTTGVCAVNIDEDEGDLNSVQLTIPTVEVDGETYPVSDNMIDIPAGTKKLAIDAYALTYGLGNPRISYYLEGFDEEEIVTTKQDMGAVVYTNLDGGKYVFHLNVINDDTGEVENSREINIVKETSLYENVIFWMIMTILLVAIVALFMWRYFKRKTFLLMQKQEEDRLFIEQIMHTFAKCVDLRDTQNQGHSFRVAYYTRMLAEHLAEKRGYTKSQIEEFYHIALMHDIGKINIPDKILNKTERLNDEEYAIMKSHTVKGEELLQGVNIVPNLAFGAAYHHERLDGKGYPRGLSGDEIPEAARLIAVADTFDAMYSTRPYRKQMLLSDVIAELQRVKGTQLEAEVVDALSELADENLLNKDKVDEYIRVHIYGKSDEKEKEKKAQQEELAKKNMDFMKSLGLRDEDEDDEDDY